MAVQNVLTTEAMITVLQNATDCQAVLKKAPSYTHDSVLESVRDDVTLFVEMFREAPARSYGMQEHDVKAVKDVQKKLASFTDQHLTPTTRGGELMPTTRQIRMISRIMAAHYARVQERLAAKRALAAKVAAEEAERESEIEYTRQLAERVQRTSYQAPAPSPAPTPIRRQAPSNLPAGAKVIYPEPVVVMPGYTYQAPAVRRARRYFRKAR